MDHPSIFPAPPDGNPVTAEQAIDLAIERGQREGLAALDAVARWVFVVSEAEVLCDKDGVDSFIDRYGRTGLLELADAYRRLGAESLAAASQAVAETLPTPSEAALDLLNQLVRGRVGYDYEALRAAVARQLGGGLR
jgi:hypothetical protein